jgi:FkbM family methyltransferase
VKAISPDCRYVGFEPNLACVDYVADLIKVNDLTRTTVLPFGISQRTGTVKLNFFDHSNTDSGASMVEGFRDQSLVVKTIEVNVYAVSDIPLLSQLQIGILKVDVEGAEYEVLNSFKDKIASDRPVILLEVLPVHSPLNFSRITAQDNIMNLLHELRYQIFRVNKEGDDFHGLTAIDSFGIHDDLNLCDYVMVPAEIRDLYA